MFLLFLSWRSWGAFCDFDGNFVTIFLAISVQNVKILVNLVKKGLDNLVNV